MAHGLLSVDRVANSRHPFLFAALKRDPWEDDYREGTGEGRGGEGDGGLRSGLSLHLPRRELISSHDERHRGEEQTPSLLPSPTMCVYAVLYHLWGPERSLIKINVPSMFSQ